MKKILILLFSILLSFNSYGDSSDETICVETDAQIINDLYYLPNTTKPFTGNNLCKYANGQLITEGKVKKGKIVSLTKYSYYENGQIDNEIIYKDGGERGDVKFTYWYENGQIKKEENYKLGELNGKYNDWYENGQIKTEANYKDSKEDGKFTTWYENGQKSYEANYKDSERDGKWTKWHENGKKMWNCWGLC